jgi:hypothetical protein
MSASISLALRSLENKATPEEKQAAARKEVDKRKAEMKIIETLGAALQNNGFPPPRCFMLEFYKDLSFPNLYFATR